MTNLGNTVKSSPDFLTGKLGFTSEPGGKTRRFAIADY
jgi:hypothetical protein